MFQCLFSILLIFAFALFLAYPVAGTIQAQSSAVDEFEKIPSEVLNQIKARRIHFASSSCGENIITAMMHLSTLNPMYKIFSVRSRYISLPSQSLGSGLRIYVGNPYTIAVRPEGYWASDIGRERTAMVAQTGNYDYSMYIFCDELGNYPPDKVLEYLQSLNSFEQDFSQMRFIYVTARTDGTHTPDMPGTVSYNNNLIRQYTQDNNKILFDIEDIERHDPYGNYHENTFDCSWCENYCAENSVECSVLPAGIHATDSPYNGIDSLRKAKALWWLLARLEGWENEDEPIPHEYHPADTNEDGCVDDDEIVVYIDFWFSGAINIQSIIEGIDVWKEGCES